MGGSPTSTPNTGAQAADSAAITSLIQAQQQQAAAAQKTAWQQQQAAISEAQRTTARQQGVQGNLAAGQQLQQENMQQQATDADIKSKQTTAANAAAIASAGGQFNPEAQKATALANLGLVAGGLPSTPANQAGSGVPAANPAATTAAAINQQGQAQNSFQMPSMNGITFGGKK